METLLEQIESLEGQYELQAELFIQGTNSKLSWKYNGLSNRFKAPYETLEYTFTLSRGSREYSGLFNSSRNDLQNLFTGFGGMSEGAMNLLIKEIAPLLRSDKKIKAYSHILERSAVFGPVPMPSAYDLLAGLQAYEVDTIDDFISEYGYDVTTHKVSELQAMYDSVVAERDGLMRLYNDAELEALHAIN